MHASVVTKCSSDTYSAAAYSLIVSTAARRIPLEVSDLIPRAHAAQLLVFPA